MLINLQPGHQSLSLWKIVLTVLLFENAHDLWDGSFY